MEIFSALLAICAGNSPVSGEFPAQRPVTRSFDIFFDLRLNKRLSKQSWGWWFETPSCPLWRHRNARPPLAYRAPWHLTQSYGDETHSNSLFGILTMAIWNFMSKKIEHQVPTAPVSDCRRTHLEIWIYIFPNTDITEIVAIWSCVFGLHITSRYIKLYFNGDPLYCPMVIPQTLGLWIHGLIQWLCCKI